jgi:hypothetical protein
MTGIGLFLNPLPGRRGRRGAQEGGRSRARQRTREEFAAKLVQALTLTLVCGALVWLIFGALRVLHAHFLAKYGARAWLLPLGIGLVLLFLLYHLYRLWSEVRALQRERGENHNS